MKVELYSPFPPSINNYYVKTRNGVFISKKGSEHRERVIEAVAEQLGPFDPIIQAIHMSVVWFMPDRRKRDLDNYLKPLLDGFTHSGIYLDDSQINQLFVYRGVVLPPSGSVFVRISEAAPIIRMQDLHLID